ncbi:thermonuclease family protein [Microvirga sp. ACRRW]|uniref:thermonuclease family protein n=1 Tax=Microvirga sp. ACRRW TaxID=2918205 RepID=UPI001EF603EA|nr:thermonuclease family protein [Microvirga sp. ACRRW]MCG7393638.1 thermonuclease family protein [Microvirga sp. ACRRW]
MRIGIALGIWAAFSLEAAAQERTAPRPAPLSCVNDAKQDRLEGISPEGDLILASERLARLSGIRFPDTHRQQALDWLRAKVGQPLLVTVQGSRDRWDRMPLRARMQQGSLSLDLGHGLVEAGLALVDAGADPVFCHPELLALEETARERHLGLWADDRYNPIPVDQADRLKERVGRFVIVEGRVRSVGERKQRTYLNFGGHWAEDFTIIIPRKAWMQMAERGFSAASLKGSTLRARGILQSWQGTALTIDLPEMIERLEGTNLPGNRSEGKRLAR